MTGTSMAAPMAASFTALLQQMIEDDYGYTPSAPLLKAMLAASAQGINSNQPDARLWQTFTCFFQGRIFCA